MIEVKEGNNVFVDIAGVIIFVRSGSPRVVATRAVDEDIALAKIFQHLLVDLLQGGFLQHVSLVRLGNAALRHNFLGIFIRGLLVQIQKGNLCAALGNGFCKHAAKHAAGSRDNRNFTV